MDFDREANGMERGHKDGRFSASQLFPCTKQVFLRTIRVPACWLAMEYRGKQYTIVQGIGPNPWKWTVHLDERTVKTGEANSREAATNSVVWLIGRAVVSQNAQPLGPMVGRF